MSIVVAVRASVVIGEASFDLFQSWVNRRQIDPEISILTQDLTHIITSV